MVSKRDFKRISDYIFEIPKTYRPDMRVPARIYADDALLEAALGDRSVEQLINTATLPGVVRYTLAMPDIHQGYGPPIGGVIATQRPSGIISPGATGYDINCLAADTPILHEFGYTRPIGEMAEIWDKASLRCQDFASERPASTPVVRFLKLRPRHPVYKVITESGREITATADHPFWTPDGMVELRYLKPGNQVALYPFEGVPYEEPSDDVIVDESDIEEVLVARDKHNALPQVLNILRQRGLLPLRFNSPALPYLLKIMGYIFGDATLYFNRGSGQGMVTFYGKPEDLEVIRKDIRKLGFSPSGLYLREREHRVETPYAPYEFTHQEASFKVTSTAFAALLAAMGAPVGNKAKSDFSVPAWVFRAPLWQKRLFLAAFFGAELTAPRTFPERDYNFQVPVLSLNKREGAVESGRKFLKDIASLLSEFGVETKKISLRREQSNKDGSVSYRLRLVLSSRPESLINLWGKVGFEYNLERSAIANVAVQYLRLKERVLSLRREKAFLARDMYAQGETPSAIYRQLSGPYVNRRFLERSIYQGRASDVRISEEFPGFHQYYEEATAGLGSSGMVWDHIARIEPIPEFDDYVYDFTVAHHDHNFIAGGFVVSNCGVRLLVSNLEAEEVKPYMETLVNALFANVPSGVGRGGAIRLDEQEMNKVLKEGAVWAIKHGYGTKDDLEHTEEGGSMAGADPSKVSRRAKQRGRDQLGTLGSGNHFIEVAVVEEIYDEEVAKAFGLFEGQLAVWIHSGSRGLGHQVCSDYVKSFQQAVRKYGIKLPDRELVCAPFDTPEGQAYFGAMASAANFAWANRQCLAHLVRRTFEQVLAGKVRDWRLRQLYDVAHNIVKLEEHRIDGGRVKVCVHRKGATRAFGPGQPAVPQAYRDVGQPVLIPGDMGTASYVLVGTQKAMEETFGTTCHGAGRVMSRAKAKRTIRGSELVRRLRAEGIIIKGGSMAGLAEEAPDAYKDVDRVVNVVHAVGIARKVAKLRPLGVIKG